MFVLLLLLLLTTLAFWNFYWKRRALPPGPTPLPFFGNTLALKSSLYEPFRQWTREYGPIFTVWMGDEPMVMVTEYEAMRELFVKDGDTFAGRHFLVDLSMEFSVSKGKRAGVVCTEGELWKATRRAGLQWMRNLGVGKASMERQYLADIEAMIGRIREKVPSSGNVWGTEVELQPHIDRLIGSTINRLLFGFAFSDDQLSMFYRLKEGMDRQQQLMSTVTGNMLMSRPWLRHLPVFSSTFAFLDHNASQLFAYFNRSIQQRVDEREKLDRRDPPQDMVDHFLDQMELSKEDPDQANYFSLDALHMFCLDMFIAGQETTSTTLSFLVLYLLLDQQAQAKLHAELDGLEKTGTTDESTADMITLADRPKLPFLNAVINESQRLCNLLAINLTHRTMADVEIMGGKYLLRKGTTVVPQISALLFDERVFPNPMRFEPERFLDEQGQLKRCDELIPFSLGKRICMGESLARMELFLFTANFFRHFRILPVDPLNPPSSERLPSFTARTHPYNCRLVLRQKE